MYRQTECLGKRLKIRFTQNHQKIAVFLAAFLLLFIGSVRSNVVSALVISLFDTLWIILMSMLFDRLLNVNGFRFQGLNLLILSLVLVAFVQILFLMERFIWNPLFFDGKLQLFPFALYKDLLIVLGTFIGSLVGYLNKQRRETERLNFEKQDMELRFLKSQISPHFLFNILNNIYSLVYTKNEQAPGAILKLADMLRYVTDECQTDVIQIEKELKYLENYIDLQILKIGDAGGISMEYDIDDYNVRIPPMILQPIVENSFKYSGLETHPDARIIFKIKIKRNDFSFEAFNTKKKMLSPAGSLRTGVGISNVEQRLKLYFKENYQLKIKETENTYSVKLEIDLLKSQK